MHQLSPSFGGGVGRKTYKKMKYTIALLAGDGMDQVINEAVKVSDAIAKKFNHEIIWTPALTGACAIDAVGVPIQMKHTKYAWQLLFYLDNGHQKYDNDQQQGKTEGLLLMRKN
jgi:3-isopropylmalate dehydrogenase